MWTIYGIKTCDTVRKTLKWLDGDGIAYRYVDLRADGFSHSEVTRWVEALGWESVLNRRSTTWRNLAEADKTDIDAQKAVALMVEHPTLIKRPICDDGARVVVGFGEDQRAILAAE